MEEIKYVLDTFHHYNGKNWLGSEVGAVKKTTQIDDTVTNVEENGRKIVKSGTYVTSPLKGLVLSDIDVTDGSAEASVLIRGSYIDKNLPTSVSAYASALADQGLYAFDEGEVTRPDFGTENELVSLTIGTPTASAGTLSWAAVTGAVGYDVYFSTTSSGDFELVTTVTTASYKATKSGYYKVQAIGDHLDYADSALSMAVSVTVSA